ncbi:MAG: sigma-70 family RNA polymerase sigma factor [Planctomycetes bacterium]|nr:sigma-70 family RNA polymerase sigma factor [Planctomycetota bacterium]
MELDDLLQEVCLRAIRDRRRAPGAEEGDAAFGRWLAELARHVVIDGVRFWRAAKRGEHAEHSVGLGRLGRADGSTLGPSESALLAATAGPATRAGAAEEQARLERAFASLPPDQRRVIALRQLEGLPAAEVARRMGRSETAVHSLYRRALLAWQAAAGLS